MEESRSKKENERPWTLTQAQRSGGWPRGIRRRVIKILKPRDPFIDEPLSSPKEGIGMKGQGCQAKGRAPGGGHQSEEGGVSRHPRR